MSFYLKAKAIKINIKKNINFEFKTVIIKDQKPNKNIINVKEINIINA